MAKAGAIRGRGEQTIACGSVRCKRAMCNVFKMIHSKVVAKMCTAGCCIPASGG